MDKADWVVLRLIKKMTGYDLARAAMDVDVRNALVYLDKKYGKKKLNECIDLLNMGELR